ncbi:predicted protein [Nematostella vectensis]|uniref:Uncharacterized protein n=1 Tax=Nematostella vectensis TaxID=45351 RepID=A7T4I8_NEMVE|nr:predicted protein [Nematostella vectensis]|eukprot:XP_001621224.1 hypothetical protein NEMVEDRAFT_v1g222227 [Nematostella vectensis]
MAELVLANSSTEQVAQATKEVRIDPAEAYERGKLDLNFFASLLIPSVMRTPFPDFYCGIFRIITNRNPEQLRKILRFALGLPRAHAKTTFVKVLICWLIVYDKISFVAILCANMDLASELMSDVSDMLGSSNCEAVYGLWARQLTVDNKEQKKCLYHKRDVILIAKGADGAVRGLNIKHKRPDLIFCDDAQTKENDDSPTERVKFRKWLVAMFKIITPDPVDRLIIYVGNMYSEECILYQLKNNPRWISFITGAIKANGEPLWPELHSLEDLYESYEHDAALNEADVWFAEVMNDPVSRTTSLLTEQLPEYKYNVEEQIPDGVFVTIDPAGFRENSDDNVIVLHYVFDGKGHVVSIDAGIKDPEQLIKAALTIAIEHGASLIGIEEAGYQQTLLFWMNKYITAWGIEGIHVVPLKHAGRSKETRIRLFIAELLSSNYYIVARAKAIFIWQAMMYKIGQKKNKDDILDACAYALDVRTNYWHLITNLKRISLYKLTTEKIATVHKNFEGLNDKMDAIDIAYARYQAFSPNKPLIVDGIDVRRDADVPCDVFESDNVVPPIVVSQVDSVVGYLTDVFLSGTPLFPVVSNPSNKKWAEQLETLLDDHASIGGYARQLLLFLRDGVKYNYSAIETDWTGIEQFSVAGALDNATGKKVTRTPKKYTKIKRLNPRNTFRDTSVAPGDVAEIGDYAGYVELVSRMRLKKELNALTDEKIVYNAERAITSADATYGPNISGIYRDDPQISDYINALKRGQTTVDWDVWLDGKKSTKQASYGQMYERVVLYARIMPSDFAISAPMPNTPQIWKFIIINGSVVISAKRIISAYDYLPILFGQPLEDGLGYQTQSVAEGEIPFQDAASKLFNIKFAASRRAVSDRAIFDESELSSKHVNSPTASPKIPAKISALSNKKLGDLYYPIPFDMRGTENTIQDAQTIVNFSKDLHGMNNPRQGQFQKGNKSVVEWEDTMGGSDNRLRLPALVLEHQVFAPLKSILVLNIYQYGTDTAVVSQRSGEVLNIDLDQLRKQVLAFRVADGMTPKSKMASTAMITTGLQMIATSQGLQAAYGPSLPAMFAHMMQLGGVRGLEEYDPNFKPGNALPGQNLQANTLQEMGQPGASAVQPEASPQTQLPLQQNLPSNLP